MRLKRKMNEEGEIGGGERKEKKQVKKKTREIRSQTMEKREEK